jgi:hypothetical protein
MLGDAKAPEWRFPYQLLGMDRRKFSSGYGVVALPDGSLVPSSSQPTPSLMRPKYTHRDNATIFQVTGKKKNLRTKPFTIVNTYGERDVLAKIPPLMVALMAREDILAGKDELASRFATSALQRRFAPPTRDRRFTGDWCTSVTEALLSDWVAPLRKYQSVPPSMLETLRNKVWRIHADLQPIWERRTGGSRVLLLDTPLGTNFTLYDLLAESPSAADMDNGEEPNDVRLRVLLRALSRFDRAVVLAWIHPGVATWADAALQAEAPDPEADGERVRRRVRRLVAEQRRRSAAAEGLWLPGTAVER